MGSDRSLRIHGYFLVAALIVQYALGMYVNLFVSFPDGATEGQLWEFAWSQHPLAGHILLAMLILLGGIVLLVRAVLRKNKIWTWAAVVGLVAVLCAGGSGALFIPSQRDLYSYSMSLMFLVAILAYASALFATSSEA